jgi:glycosyltransferase involved in cell wall biosynthesis
MFAHSILQGHPVNEYTKQISVFMPSVNGGGAERAMVNLVNGLAEYSTAIDLVLVDAVGTYKNDISKRVKVVDLKSRSALRSMPMVIRYLRANAPTAMISVLDHAFLVSMWARSLARVKTRIFVSVQNNLSRANAHATHPKERAVSALLYTYYPHADEIIAVSKGVAKDVSKTLSIPITRIKTIYNPVITPQVYERAAISIDHPWFQLGQPPVVLGIGRLTKQKNFETLIEAFAEVVRHRPARLIILGEGEDRAKLESLVQQLDLNGVVALPGFAQNPYAHLARCGVFVLSSLWEGLPTVVIEALACGASVVATDCPSGPREILEDGRWGSLVPCADPHALATHILKSLDCPNAHMPSPRASAFSIENVVKQYLELLHSG